MSKNVNLQKVIVALDVKTLKEAHHFVKLLKKETSLYKVGSLLFTAAGPDVVRMIHDEGGRVFLDLKYHDIPHTVGKACEVAAKLGVFMVDLHACGGKEMIQSAVQAVKSGGRKRPLLIGVTVLTSDPKTKNLLSQVTRLALEGQAAGLDGVVCSPEEITKVRQACGKKFLIVTPGIRQVGDRGRKDDQRRVATAKEAFRRGSDYIVVGRPILEAKDPLRTVQSLFLV